MNIVNGNVSVTVVAVVKDEAPYIAEWVFHHKYFGIDNFHFMINRTSDETEKVLNDLANVTSNITYEYIDWIDQCNTGVANSIQQIAYAKAFYDLKNNTDYIFFLDIDEFWCSKNFENKISNVIKELSKPECITFLWHCELGKLQNFSGFSQNTKFYKMGLGKSIIKTDSTVKGFRAHVPELNSSSLLPNGEKFISISNNAQVVIKELVRDYEYFVVHRIFKGEKEFLANIAKGDMHTGKKMKTNRKSGFITDHKDSDIFHISNNCYEKYTQYMDSELKKLSININKLQEDFIYGYQEFIQNIPFFYVTDKDVLVKTMVGIQDPNVIKLMNDCSALENKFRPLFNHALKYEKDEEYLMASAFMKAAQCHLPNSDRVKEKLDYYLDKIN